MPIEVVAKEPVKAPGTTGFWWGVYLAGVACGFFVGVAVSEWEGDNPMAAAFTAWEPISAAIPGVAVGVALLHLLRGRGVPLVLPGLAFVGAAAGAFLVVFGGRAVDDLRGAAQLRAWFGTAETRVGVVLVLAALVLTLVKGDHHDPHREH